MSKFAKYNPRALWVMKQRLFHEDKSLFNEVMVTKCDKTGIWYQPYRYIAEPAKLEAEAFVQNESGSHLVFPDGYMEQARENMRYMKSQGCEDISIYSEKMKTMEATMQIKFSLNDDGTIKKTIGKNLKNLFTGYTIDQLFDHVLKAVEAVNGTYRKRFASREKARDDFDEHMESHGVFKKKVGSDR